MVLLTVLVFLVIKMSSYRYECNFLGEIFTFDRDTFQNESEDHNDHKKLNPIIQKLSVEHMMNLKTGTTIVGMSCLDGVVLGADTRSTGGPFVMDKEKLKIHKMANLIYCCAAGTSADCDQITRESSHLLALLRLDRELSNFNCGSGISSSDTVIYDPIPIALQSICKLLQLPRRSNSGDMRSSVMIVGGVDESGPSLHMIDSDCVPVKVSFAALGSGSTDAIAVIENYLHNKGSGANARKHVLISDAIEVVRKAVSAGILNDLGSGSHVDLCVIEKYGATTWRERSTLSDNTLPSYAKINRNGNETITTQKFLGKLLRSREKLSVNEMKMINRESEHSSYGCFASKCDVDFV